MKSGLKVFLLLFCGGRLLAQTPANDNFADRLTLAGTNLTLTATNVGASKEPGEPNHWSRFGSSSVWWTWHAPAAGQVVISTEGSSFDTVIAAYVGSSLANLGLVAGNDDHIGLFTSRLWFLAASNTDYQIAVDGFNGASGNIALALNFTTAPVLRPPNDDFANRAVFLGNGNVSGSNTFATREVGEPFHAAQPGGTSIWWTWTAPASAPVRFSTAGSDFDTTLAVYTGSSVSNLQLIASNDDENSTGASAVSFNAVVGQAYQIAVDGYDGASGRAVLSIGSAELRLTAAQVAPNRQFQFTLSGPPGRTNQIYVSQDLKLWTPLATVLNTNGTLVFSDPAATNYPARFYRALLK
jgi:hypothetical protein